MSGQVKIFFDYVAGETPTAFRFWISGKDVWLARSRILKICFIYNYVLLRRDYAKEKGLV